MKLLPHGEALLVKLGRKPSVGCLAKVFRYLQCAKYVLYHSDMLL